MLQYNPPKQLVWNQQYNRYQINIFNHATQQWVFSSWAPPQQPQYDTQPILSHRADLGTHDTHPTFAASGTLQPSSFSTAAHASSSHSRPVYDVQLSPWLSDSTNQYQYRGYQQPTSSLPPHPPQVTKYFPTGEGLPIIGTYSGPHTLRYERVDPEFFVRDSSFFFEGRVFAVIMNETAGSTSRTPKAVDYNTSSSMNQVKYEGNWVYTDVRRFVVVRKRHEFCYACPIFTYAGRATLKNGARPQQHGIAYSWGQSPTLLQGETGITKDPIAVVMVENESNLDAASRIYYGIHHPIQYNVKVKEIGYVPGDHMPILKGNWLEEEQRESQQRPAVTNNTDVTDRSNRDGRPPPGSSSKGKSADPRYRR